MQKMDQMGKVELIEEVLLPNQQRTSNGREIRYLEYSSKALMHGPVRTNVQKLQPAFFIEEQRGDVDDTLFGDSCHNSTEAHIPTDEEDALLESVPNTQSSIIGKPDAEEQKAPPSIERPKLSGARHGHRGNRSDGSTPEKLNPSGAHEVKTANITASKSQPHSQQLYRDVAEIIS
ncbi:hypothetical protein FF38_08831 [Lucilia cuprina]|uniref:Uncharacterized protein n=1 Tax=Lucilia cuprina TaxID=7375 RepID=A0A0L0BU25_LUCCU|nr:hypothetical protein FF38_08831 [Lucilia cuprina]